MRHLGGGMHPQAPVDFRSTLAALSESPLVQAAATGWSIKMYPTVGVPRGRFIPHAQQHTRHDIIP